MSDGRIPARVAVVGTGLIGTSVGLALAGQGIEVHLLDRSTDRLRLAADLGAGRPGTAAELQAAPVEVVLLCLPPAAVAPELLRLQDLGIGQTYSDTASIKSLPQAEAQRVGARVGRFVGGHPVAGRERSGPAAARGDLFLGRPWVLTPSAETAPDALQAVTRVVEACGAVPVRLDPVAHDQAMARVSHVPQLVASALAAQLVDADPAAIALGGQGLRDLTRIADSDPELWADIVSGNAGPVGTALGELSGELATLAALLTSGPDTPRHSPAEAVRRLVRAGNEGRGRLPGKHGARATPYVAVPVAIVDEPGTLARLLTDAGAAAVNVEDLSLEHSPGAPVGLCELYVRPEQAGRLREALAAAGWAVHAPDLAGREEDATGPRR